MATRTRTATRLATAAVAATVLAPAPTFAQQRVFGVDVSDWQGPLSQTQWNSIYNANKRFAFIRSSRGGTTGYYNESDPNNLNGQNTQSQRYDDPYFTNNINRATKAGLLAGAYHFDRADILSYVNDAGQTVTHTGTDEANHFLQQAGQWMRPGFLLPVLDLEAGANRTVASLSTFATDFANRLIAVKGISPIAYMNTSYAVDQINSTVPAKMPYLWLARPEGNSSTGDPTYTGTVTRYENVYGVYNPAYPNTPSPAPWAFWQYGSTTITGVGTIDGNVAHGDIEYLKDFLVPALWTTDSSGTWTTTANWNINAIYDPGADGVINPATDALLYAARTPQGDDTVILDRGGAANPTITLSSATPSIRRLTAREALTVTSAGALTVQKTADFFSPLSLAGAVSADTATFNAGSSLNLSPGGVLTATTLNLNTNITMTGAGTATLKPTAGQAGSLSLGSGNRTLDVATGGTLSISLPISSTAGTATNTLTKSGAGDLVLTGTTTNLYPQITSLNGGRIIVEKNGALGGGSASLSTSSTIFTAGSASTLAFRAPAGSPGFQYTTLETIKTDGTGAPGFAQIDNLAGDNRFAGYLVLSGPAGTVRTASLGATAGSLELAGPLYAAGTGPTVINKTGAGTLILSGNSAAAPVVSGASALSGATLNVTAGTLTLKGPSDAAAPLPGVTTWTVSPASTLNVASGRLTASTLSVAPTATLNQTGGSTTVTGTLSGGGAVNVSANTLTAGGLDVCPLTVSTASSVIIVPSTPVANRLTALTLNGTGTLDLANAALVLDYTGTNPLSTLSTQITAAYNHGLWNQPGLTSSLAADPAYAYYGQVALGFADNASLALTNWLGRDLDPSSLLVRFTWYGDANLDGTVDASDLQALVAGTQRTPGSSTWSTGDFNYDGTTNADDYTLFSLGLTHQTGTLTPVPEPTTLLAILPLLPLLTPRRRPRAC